MSWLTEREPTGAGLELGHLQGSLQPKPHCGSTGSSPSTAAQPRWGLVAGLITVSMEDKQTNKHWPCRQQSQTKEISSEIEVILKFTSKKNFTDLRLLPFIWLTAHDTGVLSPETSKFIFKNQLQSKPSTFTKHIQKDLTLLNPHTHEILEKKKPQEIQC